MLFAAVSAGGKDRQGVPVAAGTAMYQAEDRTGAPHRLSWSAFVPAPSFNAVSRTGILFTTSENEDEGRVSLNDGFLGSSSRSSGGQGAVHAAIDAGNRFIAVANYREESRGADLSIAVFPFDEKGRLGEMTGSARHEGRGPDMSRQSSPHTHCVMFSPDNRLLAAVDLGTDGLWLYRFDQETGEIALATEVKLPPGSGPRHCVFHPSRPYLYVCGELDSTLMTLRYDSIAGTAQLLDTEPATGTQHSGRNYPSGMAIAPDGHYLMLANRGPDTIATFWIEPDTGLARRRDEVSCGGRFPRAIRLDKTGRVLAIANQKSGNIVLFERDFATGRLTAMPNGEIDLPSAMDVIFFDQ
jgi:6-phosphogluconolactonase